MIILAAIVGVGFLIVVWQLAMLIQAVRLQTRLVIQASDMAHDNAHNILEAVTVVWDTLSAPKCEVGGCHARATVRIHEYEYPEDRTRLVCAEHDTWGEKEERSMFSRWELPEPRSMDGVLLTLERYRDRNPRRPWLD